MHGFLTIVALMTSYIDTENSLTAAHDLEKKVHELEVLLATISQGKYMWESTFDAIADPVLIVGLSYKIVRANRTAASAANTDVRSLIGTICYESLAGRKEPCEGCPLERSLALGKQAADLGEFPKNRRMYTAHAYALKLEGQPEQSVVHYRDVTEERALQGKLVQSEKLAAIGTLAGGVAHEINNPLGGILAFTQLIMRDLASDHASQKDLKEIQDAVLRCKSIVQDLLDFSRQRHHDAMEVVNLNEVLQKIQPLMRVQTKAARIQIQFDLADDIPFLWGSSHKLQQVFINLVTNAYQAISEQGEVLVRTYFDREHGKICAEISDNGAGISPEHLSKVFDPYFTTKAQGEGTGLGLSITYGIVREHEGTIDVESQLGAGTKFCLRFPVYSKG
jgi:two-component system NtrC family sensor kinase